MARWPGVCYPDCVRTRFSRILAPALLLCCVTPQPGSRGAYSAEKTEPPSPAERKTRYVVAAIGDSLTATKSHGGKFLTYLQKKCPESRFDNYGKGADMVNQMRRRFRRQIIGHPAAKPPKPSYTHVIIFGGVNDLYSDLTAKRTPAKIGRDLTQMYEMSHERGAAVVALTVAPWGGFSRYYNPRRGAATREVNRWIFEQKKQGKIEYVIDAYGLLSCGDPDQLCPKYNKPFHDGLHLGKEGHERLGEALYKTVFSDCR